MRYAAGHREQTRAKILRAAGKVFRRQGYHAAGVDKVMEEAGLTAGGFYAHFASKEALLAEMLAPAASGALHDEHIEYLTNRACAEAFVDRYLSHEHVVKTEDGCPLPPLVSEVARAGESVKANFEASVRGLATQLQGQDGGGVSEDRCACSRRPLCRRSRDCAVGRGRGPRRAYPCGMPRPGQARNLRRRPSAKLGQAASKSKGQVNCSLSLRRRLDTQPANRRTTRAVF